MPSEVVKFYFSFNILTHFVHNIKKWLCIRRLVQKMLTYAICAWKVHLRNLCTLIFVCSGMSVRPNILSKDAGHHRVYESAKTRLTQFVHIRNLCMEASIWAILRNWAIFNIFILKNERSLKKSHFCGNILGWVWNMWVYGKHQFDFRLLRNRSCKFYPMFCSVRE